MPTTAPAPILRLLVALVVLGAAGFAAYRWRTDAAARVTPGPVSGSTPVATAVQPPPPPSTPPPAPKSAAQLRKAKMAAEVVLRLKGADLSQDAETKAMVDKALAANEGLPAFVEIVEAFGISDRDADLLQLAIGHQDDATGALALRLVLAHRGVDPVKQALGGGDAAAIARALGNANDQRALPLLEPIVVDPSRELALRQEAVRALGHYEAGAKVLLSMRRDGKLSAELEPIAAGVLANAPWDAVRAQVQESMPAPATLDGPLPPITELATRSGDAVHGEQVFGSICVACHQVAGKGIDYGPNLSAIGKKLGKDGLYLAVLYPDAGVEFNYETTVLTLKDGNTAIGIVVSETAGEIAIKSIGGIVNRYPVADLVGRTRQKSSSMPPNLQSQMHLQDLVDLVEYLAGLKG